MATGPETVISVDFGTHGTSYSISFPTAESSTPSLAELSRKLVYVAAPGKPSYDGNKNRTALLLDRASDRFVAFGEKAVDEYSNYNDDGRGDE
jgi:hypothetical protein